MSIRYREYTIIPNGENFCVIKDIAGEFKSPTVVKRKTFPDLEGALNYVADNVIISDCGELKDVILSLRTLRSDLKMFGKKVTAVIPEKKKLIRQIIKH